MKRLIFYILKILSFLCRPLSIKSSQKLLIFAHKTVGVVFKGKPDYIETNAYLDASGGLTIMNDVVISTKVIILTHDWSFLKRNGGDKINPEKYNSMAFQPVIIGESSFIGAGAIILPGSIIGSHCIIGAGTVIKGKIDDNQIAIGNPCKILSKT